VIYFLGGKWLYSMFFEEADIVAVGVKIMYVTAVIVVLQISQVIYMGCLRGAGDVKFTTMASTISVTLIRPIVSYLCAYVLQMGVIGIWFGIVGDQIMRLILTNWRFKSGKWTKIEV